MIKIRNVENLTLGKPDTGAANGNVSIGIEATATTDYELAISRINEEPKYQLLINNESAVTDANYGGILFTQGAAADTTLASIKVDYTSAGKANLVLGTQTTSNALTILDDGKVGIGTGSSAPDTKLQVVGGEIRIDNNYSLSSKLAAGNAINLIWIDSTNKIHIGSDTSRATGFVSINSDGKVGIGTGAIAPDHPLTIHGDGQNTYIKNLVKSNHQVGLEWNRTESGGSHNGNWIMYMPASSTDLRFYSGSDRVTFTADGKVGVGSQHGTPTKAFSVRGANSEFVAFENADDDFRIGTWTDDTLHFIVNGVRQMSMKGGKVGIGTGSTAPDYTLDVNGTIRTTTLRFGSETVTATSIKDEDDMASDSNIALATQQSIKAYVDAEVTAQDLDFTTDTAGNSSVDLDSEILTLSGGEGMDVTHSGQTITIAGEDASLTNKGIASFDDTFFSASSGAISLDAVQVGITSVLNTALAIGRDADNLIDFSTDDRIVFNTNGAHQIALEDGVLRPIIDNDIDLGTSTLEFKDLYLDGTANIDSLVADTADINGGTVDGAAINSTTIGATTASTGAFTTLTASSTLDVTGASQLVGSVGIGANTAIDTILHIETADPVLKVEATGTNSHSVLNLHANGAGSGKIQRSGTDQITITNGNVVQINNADLQLGDGTILPEIGESNRYHHLTLVEDDTGMVRRAHTAVQVIISAGGQANGTNAATKRATASAIISNGKIFEVKIIDGGEGYSAVSGEQPTVEFKGGRESDANGGITATATISNTQIVSGKVTEMTITNPGNRYFGVGIVKPEETLEIADIIETRQAKWDQTTVIRIDVDTDSGTAGLQGLPYGVGYTSSPTIQIGNPWASGVSYAVTSPKTQVYGSNNVLYEITAGSGTSSTQPTHRKGDVTGDVVVHDGISYKAVGERARANAIVSAGVVDRIVIVDAGSGYNAVPDTTIVAGSYGCTTCLASSHLTAVLGASKISGFNIIPESLVDANDEITIGSGSKVPQLRISTKGLIVGFAEKDNLGGGTAGAGGGGTIDEIVLTLHDNLYVNAQKNSQQLTLTDPNSILDLYSDTSIFASKIVDSARAKISIDSSPTGGSGGYKAHDAQAVVHAGTNEKISRIDVLNTGQGYQSAPNVVINEPTKRPLAWSSTRSYISGDWVFRPTASTTDPADYGYAYKCIAPVTGGNPPESNTTNWQVRYEGDGVTADLIKIGAGTQATATATLGGTNGDEVTTITVTNIGDGYYPDDQIALLGDTKEILDMTGTPIANMASALRSDVYPGTHYRAEDIISNANNGTSPGFSLAGNDLTLKVADDSDTIDLSSVVPDKISVMAISTDADHYLTFVDSNNSSSTAESVYTDGGITYNPNDNDLTIGHDLSVGNNLSVVNSMTVGNDLIVNDDLLLRSDSSQLRFGADDDVTLTHVHDTGLLLNGDKQLQFRDAGLTINSSADGQLDIDADGTLQITAPIVDINASAQVNISHALNVGGAVNAVGIASSGDITISRSTPVLSLKDNDHTGNEHTGWIRWQDKDNAEKAWLGFGSNGHSDLGIKNNYSGGNIDLQVAGDGKVLINGREIMGGTGGNFASSKNWTVGTGSADDTGTGGNFNSVGTASESERLISTTPFGYRGILWRMKSLDTSSNSEGGWNKTITDLDINKSYMSIVFFKKVGSVDNGGFYHGTGTSTNQILSLNGTANTNPYFVGGLLLSALEDDEWYVSVGIIQANGDTNTSNKGGVWRLATGEKVRTNTSFKMGSAGATLTNGHRVYHYYSTVTNSAVDTWGPGFYEINGNEPKIETWMEALAGHYLAKINAAAISTNTTAIALNTAKVSFPGFGTSSTTAARGNHTHDNRYYTETESTTRFLRKNTSDTLSGNLTVDNGTSTTLRVKCDNAGNAIIRAAGDNQGTGVIEVGQSTTYGGGISYNGDGSPGFVTGEQSDHITFYRLNNGTRTEVFHYPYNSNTVNFNSTPTVGSHTILTTSDFGTGAGDVAEGNQLAAKQDALNTNSNVTTNSIIVDRSYTLNSPGTHNNATDWSIKAFSIMPNGTLGSGGIGGIRELPANYYTVYGSAIGGPRDSNGSTICWHWGMFNNIISILPVINISDRKAKKNIRPLHLGLDFINKLNPIAYHLKELTTPRNQYGFIADEVETLLEEEAGGINEECIIYKPEYKGEEDATAHIAYTDFIAPLVKSVQELTAKIETLENRIKELEK